MLLVILFFNNLLKVHFDVIEVKGYCMKLYTCVIIILCIIIHMLRDIIIHSVIVEQITLYANII